MNYQDVMKEKIALQERIAKLVKSELNDFTVKTGAEIRAISVDSTVNQAELNPRCWVTLSERVTND